MSQKFRNWQLIAWFPELNKLKFANKPKAVMIIPDSLFKFRKPGPLGSDSLLTQTYWTVWISPRNILAMAHSCWDCKYQFAGLLKFFRFDMLVAQMYMYIRKTISAVRRDDLLMRLGCFYLSSPIKV